MGVTIGNYSFVGPLLSTNEIEDRSGIYAVLHNTGNGNYKVIDVGESAGVKSRLDSHDRKPCWLKHCSPIPYYAVHYTPNQHQSGRMDIEQELRRKFQPPCGTL